MAGLVRFVEQTRGLRFHHPVSVAFLSDADFRRDVINEAGSGSADAGAAEGNQEATARALGLLRATRICGRPGTPCPAKGSWPTRRLTKRVEVRGADLTVGRRVTIVHELTHALQDQYFDLSRQDESDSTTATPPSRPWWRATPCASRTPTSPRCRRPTGGL